MILSLFVTGGKVEKIEVLPIIQSFYLVGQAGQETSETWTDFSFKSCFKYTWKLLKLCLISWNVARRCNLSDCVLCIAYLSPLKLSTRSCEGGSEKLAKSCITWSEKLQNHIQEDDNKRCLPLFYPYFLMPLISLLVFIFWP